MITTKGSLTFSMIVANWKMNGDDSLVNSYKIRLKKYRDFIVCPPFPYIENCSSDFLVGAQNCHHNAKGAYTGEVSAAMLREKGCQYVLLGHSERRTFFGEDVALIEQKIKTSLLNNLKPIVCVSSVNECPQSNDVWIAYEPTSAIGTGKTPAPQEIGEMIQKIKDKTHVEKVLYGGSVNEKNIQQIKPYADGFLVGGASLDVDVIEKMLLLY